MANNKPCPICELGESVCTEIARQVTVGLPASDITAYLGSLGHRRTQRQLVDHRRHVVSVRMIRPSIAATPDNPEVCQTSVESPATLHCSEEGLSDIEREERLIMGLLTATDRMLESLEKTGSIKISRAVTELGSLAHRMLQQRMTRTEPLDPVVNIIINRKVIEGVIEDFHTNV